MARIPKIRSRKDRRMVSTMSWADIADVSLAPNGARTSFVYNKLGSPIRTTGPSHPQPALHFAIFNLQ
jgi:hypothetical protein